MTAVEVVRGRASRSPRAAAPVSASGIGGASGKGLRVVAEIELRDERWEGEAVHGENRRVALMMTRSGLFWPCNSRRCKSFSGLVPSFAGRNVAHESTSIWNDTGKELLDTPPAWEVESSMSGLTARPASAAPQRCPDCNTFCATVGPSGQCPPCDEPVAITDPTEQQAA
jgi:hypothetical protein